MMEMEQALRVIRDLPAGHDVESVDLAGALGRVLAGELASPVDCPPFDKSSMDGFAVGADDGSAEFRVRATIAAGAGGGPAIHAGECARIMTGAMLPPGTGRVIRREYVDERDGIVRPHTPEPYRNVVSRGSSLRAGQPLMGPRVLAAQDIGALAASGIDAVPVAVPPSTTILSTGSEVVPAGRALGPGQIYNSNAPQLAAQLTAMRCPSRFAGTVEDSPDSLTAAIEAAMGSCGLLLMTGGVSAGDFDYVPDCLSRLGARILFHGVAVKPGKPLLFAHLGQGFVFGLPGNPVSTFVAFELFVKPFLFHRMGVEWSPVAWRGRLARRVARNMTDRVEYLPVRARAGRVEPVAYHGSAHLNALCGADGLIRIEKGVAALEEGAEVDVRPI